MAQPGPGSLKPKLKLNLKILKLNFEMHKKFNKIFKLNFLCNLIYCKMGIEIKVRIQIQFFSPVQQRPQKLSEFAKSKFKFENLTTNEPGQEAPSLLSL